MSKRTLVVSVIDYSFEQAAERRFYACPASYGRGPSEYVAFYRGKPVSAITHYAKVEQIGEDDELLTHMNRIRMFPDHFDEPATVFRLGELRKLRNPVRGRNGRGLQGAVYTELKQLKSVEFIQDL